MSFTKNVVGTTVWDEEVAEGEQFVGQAGVAVRGILAPDGVQSVGFGGIAIDTQVASGGRQVIEYGGAASRTVIASGGTLELLSGSLIDGITQSAGGALIAEIGGGEVHGRNGRSASGGSFYISGNSAVNLDLARGGRLTVDNGTFAINTRIDVGGTLVLKQGATASGVLQLHGGALDAATDCVVSGSNTRRDTNGSFSISGGTAQHLLLENGGVLLVSSRHKAVDTLVSSGGMLTVQLGGSATGTQIAGGAMFLQAGGSAIRSEVFSGGSVFAAESATLNSVSVATGGVLELVGSASSVRIFDKGRVLARESSFLSNVRVVAGGVLELESGAVVSQFVQSFGGALVADAGATLVSGSNANTSFSIIDGLAQNVLLEHGGRLTVASGHRSLNTLARNGGVEVLSQGGTAQQTILRADGVQQVESGGTARQTVISSGGSLVVCGGNAVGAMVLSGGTMLMESGGTGLNAVISRGGLQLAGEGGMASNTTVSSGGTQCVLSGGSALNTIVERGGSLVVAAEGDSFNAMIRAGGWMFVAENGSGREIAVHSGGMLENAGRLGTVVVNEGGSIRLAAGGVTDTLTLRGIVASASTEHTVSAGTASWGTFSILEGVASGYRVDSGGTFRVEEGDWAVNTTLKAGGHMEVASGGRLDGSLKLSGGLLLEDAYALLELDALSFVLDASTIDETQIVVNGTGFYSAASVTIDVNNVISGTYTLVRADNLEMLSGRTWTISSGALNLSITVDGPSISLPEGRRLTLTTSRRTDGREELLFRIDCPFLGGASRETAREIEAAMTEVSGSVGGSKSLTDFYTFSLDAPGMFGLNLLELGSGVKVSLYSTSGSKVKKIKTLSVSSTSKSKSFSLLLGAETYYVEVSSLSKKKESYYRLTMDSSLFPVDNTDDNWATTPKTMRVGDAPLTDFVGYGDRYDYRTLVLDGAAALYVDLSGLENTTKLGVYELVTKSNGKQILKKIKTITVSVKRNKDGSIKVNSGSIGELLLAAGTYVVSVESPGYKSGKNSDYTLELRGGYLPCDNTDDTRSTTTKTLSWSETVNDFVGYGDESDFRRLDLSESGLFQFSVSGLTENVKLRIYRGGEVIESLTIKVKKDKYGNYTVDSGALKDLFLNAGTYYVEVSAASSKKSTNYTLSVDGRSVQAAGSDTANDKPAGATELLLNELHYDYVGQGDKLDYLAFHCDGGMFNLELAEFNAGVKITLYSYSEKGVLSKLYSATPLLDDGRWSLENYSMAAGEYRVLLESADGGKKQHANYAFGVFEASA